MTEQTSFGGLAVADPRSAASTLDVADDAGDDNRRKLAIVGAVFAVVVILIAAFFLMKGGGSNSPAPAVPHALANVGQSATATSSAAKPAKAIPLPKHFAGTVGRDPFKALYVQPADKSSTSGSTGTTTPTAPTGTTVPPVTTTSGSTGTTTTPVAGTTGSTTPVFRPVWIKLVSISGTSVKFAVGFSDHKNLKVRRYTETPPSGNGPEIFAKNFAVLRMTPTTVTLQYGDGTPFVLDMKHALMIVN